MQVHFDKRTCTSPDSSGDSMGIEHRLRSSMSRVRAVDICGAIRARAVRVTFERAETAEWYLKDSVITQQSVLQSRVISKWECMRECTQIPATLRPERLIRSLSLRCSARARSPFVTGCGSATGDCRLGDVAD